MTALPVQLPVSWVDSGYGIPSCCVLHGNPAATTKKVQFISRPPAWSYLLIVAGVLLFVIVAIVLRKSATSQAWPFCAECQQHRTKRLAIGWGLMLVGLLLFVAAAVVASNAEVGAVVASGLLLAPVVAIVGLSLVARSGWFATAGGIVSGDGAWLQFAKAHPNFAGQANAATAAANQQYTAP